MLKRSTPMAALPTTDLARAKSFYEGVLGLSPEEGLMAEGQGAIYATESGSFLVYLSQFAGTNQATSMAMAVSDYDFDDVVGMLRDNGVSFDTFEMEEAIWEDGVATLDEMRSAWFRDPDGNILNVATWPRD